MATYKQAQPPFFTKTQTALVCQILVDGSPRSVILQPGALFFDDRVRVITRRSNKNLLKGEWYWQVKLSYPNEAAFLAAIYPSVEIEGETFKQSIYNVV